MKSRYSQNNEQDIILTYFHGKTGNFLDCGSNDGITFSNVYALALQGWGGYCIEPSPKAFAKLEDNYKDLENVFLLNAAITPTDIGDKIGFFESGAHISESDISLLSTVKEGELERWKGSNNHFEKTIVNAISFEKFYSNCILKFDFVSIDCEGLDLELLKAMPLSNMGVELICLEHNSNASVKQQMIDYCFNHGLSNILLENAENIIISI